MNAAEARAIADEIQQIRQLIGVSRLGADLLQVAGPDVTDRIEIDARETLAAAQARLRLLQERIEPRR